MTHLTDLYELWMTGLDVLERYDKGTPFYDDKKKDLESALKLLRFHMVKDYEDYSYRKTVDSLPIHGEDISKQGANS